MTNEELDAIESRASAAIPGHWTAGEIGVVTTDAKVSERYDQVASVLPICDRKGHCYQDDTTRFIAHARADVPALIAEVRRLRAEAAESELLWLEKLNRMQRVFVWEPFRDEGGTHYRLCFGDEFEFQLTYYHESCCLAFWCGDNYETEWDVYRKDNEFDEAEQMIRELGFARDGDVFDRSKVEK